MGKDIQDHAEEYSSQEPGHLGQIRRETHLRTVYPQMLSGHLQGRLLSMISKLVRPKNILEIGTFTGYSTFCLLEGLTDGGKVHTIESNPETARMALNYFRQHAVEDSVILHVDDALSILDDLEGPFELVFIDADKEQYPLYYRHIISKVAPGGIILADNMFWGGKVLEEEDKMDKETRGIIEFSRTVQSDKRVEVVMLPVRDGISVIRKK